MRRLPLVLGCLLTLFVVVDAAAGYKRWEQVIDDDGIKVWTLEIPGRKLPGFRAITTIHAPIDDIVKVMIEVENHPKWMWQCKESRTVRVVNETREIVYNRINSPWPISDRDVVAEVAYRYMPNRDALTFIFHNIEEPTEPKKDGIVRLPRLQGFYRLWNDQPGQPNVTSVLYQVELDIGGNVPSFLARLYGRKVPYKTLESLRERVEHPEDVD